MPGYIAQIVSATELPVNEDFQSGCAANPEDLAKSVWLCVETGVAGPSIEDWTHDRADPLHGFCRTPSSACWPHAPQSMPPAPVFCSSRAPSAVW
jgi:hypothetical protein